MDLLLVFIAIAISIFFIIFVCPFIKEMKYEKANRERTAIAVVRPEESQEDEIAENEPVAIGARVLRKEIYGSRAGTKVSTYTVNFGVAFLTDDGEEKEFSVSEELYNAIEIDQTGMLVTINGYFLDFGDGEDIPTEEEQSPGP